MMDSLLARFDAGDLAPDDFGHREHVAVAIALLRNASFVESVARYLAGIERIAASDPSKVNVTVTVAFLSAIAERLHLTPDLTDAEFVSRYPELMSPAFLARWYDPERLASPIARQIFLLPEPGTGCLNAVS